MAEPMDFAYQLLKYARMQRHNDRRVGGRNIPRRGNKNFQRQMNEASNYDIDEMMNRDSQELQGREMARWAKVQAAQAAQEQVRGSMTPEQYNIWQERMRSMIPQEAAPGKEFGNREPPKSLLSLAGAKARLEAGETLTGQQLSGLSSESNQEKEKPLRRIEDYFTPYEQNPYENMDWSVPKRSEIVATGEPMDIAYQLLKRKRWPTTAQKNNRRNNLNDEERLRIRLKRKFSKDRKTTFENNRQPSTAPLPEGFEREDDKPKPPPPLMKPPPLPVPTGTIDNQDDIEDAEVEQ